MSKAADRSSNLRTDYLGSAFTIRKTSVTDSSAVSVEWPFLKPDWLASSRLFCEINCNVGFLSSRVTRAYLNAMGKVPVRRDVLMMCVSAAKSVGEIAWGRCEGIGYRGHVVGWLERRSFDTSALVRGKKVKRGVLAGNVVGLSSCVCEAEN